MGAAAANLRLAIGLAAAVRASAWRAIGATTAGPVSPAAGDKRFADPAYADNALYFLLAQQYLLGSQLVAELIDAAGLDAGKDKQGAVRRHVHPRRAVAHQHAAGQPCGDAGRRSTPAAGASSRVPRNMVERHAPQRRVALPGRQHRLRGRRQHGGHARAGRLPQRPDRADPVRAAGQDRCTRCRCCSARRGSTSTTSWISRPERA